MTSVRPSLTQDEQREAEAMAALSRLCDVLPVIWHMGDGMGGTIFRTIANRAARDGLPMQSVRAPKIDLRARAKKLRVAVLLRDGNTCRYCGVVPTIDAFTLDHLVPLCRGGVDELENLVVACRPCNGKKGTKELTNG